jgi:hypothetical protein
MFRKIVCLLLAVSILAVTGCSLVSKATETTTTAPASVKAVREAIISKVWKMKQMEINLDKEVSIMLELKDGDRVDGYYYLTKGDGINFNIAGVSTIYTSQPPDATTTLITSDRFSFIASQGQGVTYKLTLSVGTGSKTSEAAVFLELVYPVTGSLYVPIGTK